MPLRPSSWYEEKERMKIYTLVFGALVACPMQAQTMHDWENHHVLQINREPARAAFTPFPYRKETVRYLWTEHGSSDGLLFRAKES